MAQSEEMPPPPAPLSLFQTTWVGATAGAVALAGEPSEGIDVPPTLVT